MSIRSWPVQLPSTWAPSAGLPNDESTYPINGKTALKRVGVELTVISYRFDWDKSPNVLGFESKFAGDAITVEGSLIKPLKEGGGAIVNTFGVKPLPSGALGPLGRFCRHCLRSTVL